MNIPRITILGANGMLGSNLLKYFLRRKYPVQALTRDQFDVLNHDFTALRKYLEITDGYVINCIVHDYKSTDFDKVIAINSQFPVQLQYFCKKQKQRLIHISTNGVFAGDAGNYKEDDVPNSNTLYGISKLLGEPNQCMVIRTSFIGIENQQQSKYLLNWVLHTKESEISGYTNHWWNGITTIAFAQAIEKILCENLYQERIIHLFSDETLTKYDLLKKIKMHFQLSTNIVPTDHQAHYNGSLASNYSFSKKLIPQTLDEQLNELKEYFLGIK